MNNPYQDLNLEQLRFLTKKDAENAADATDQANVLREMSQELQDKIDMIREVVTPLFGGRASTYSANLGTTSPDSPGAWSGKSSEMMNTELRRLYNTIVDTPNVLKRNASVIDDIAEQVVATDAAVDRIQQRSGSGSEPAKTDLDEARQVVGSANTSYLETAGALTEPTFYTGLRESAPEESTAAGPRQESAPVSDPIPATPITDRTDYSQPADGRQPVGDPGSTPYCPPSSEDGDPQLQGPGPVPTPVPTGPTQVPMPSPGTIVGNPVPLPPAIPSPTSPGGLPPRPSLTVPIGERPGPQAPTRPGTPGLRTPAPRTGGPGGGRTLTPRPAPPVIGSRPGTKTGYGSPTAPRTSSPDGLSRPVIGSRPGGPSGFGKPPAPRTSGQEGLSRPVIGSRPGTGDTRGGAEGTRSTPGSGNGTGARPRSGSGTRGGSAPTPKSGSKSNKQSARAKRAESQTGSGTRVPKPAKVSKSKKTTGEVFGRRESERKTKRSKRPSIDSRAGQRAPRAVHGDNEAVNRGVIRGAKPAADADRLPPGREMYVRFTKKKPVETEPKSDAGQDNPWFDDTGTVAPVIKGVRRRPTE